MWNNISLIITGIFLLIVIQCGGYISELLTCKLQKHLSENMLYKHITLFAVIFAILMLGDSEFENVPSTHLLISSGIFISFMLFIKMNLHFTIISIILLLITLIVNHYLEFYKKKDNPNNHKDLILYLDKIKKLCIIIVAIIIVTGFAAYFLEKRQEYSKNWSTYKFFFGITKCKSLK